MSTVELPASLRKAAIKLAEEDGVSLSHGFRWPSRKKWVLWKVPRFFQA